VDIAYLKRVTLQFNHEEAKFRFLGDRL